MKKSIKNILLILIPLGIAILVIYILLNYEFYTIKIDSIENGIAYGYEVENKEFFSIYAGNVNIIINEYWKVIKSSDLKEGNVIFVINKIPYITDGVTLNNIKLIKVMNDG